MFADLSESSTRDFGSPISIEERDFLFVQFKSASVYFSLGFISYVSAFIICPNFNDTPFVFPVALKYATNFLTSIFFFFRIFIIFLCCIILLYLYFYLIKNEFTNNDSTIISDKTRKKISFR